MRHDNKTMSETKISALERSIVSYRGPRGRGDLKILHCVQTFALDLGVILSAKNNKCSVRILAPQCILIETPKST